MAGIRGRILAFSFEESGGHEGQLLQMVRGTELVPYRIGGLAGCGEGETPATPRSTWSPTSTPTSSTTTAARTPNSSNRPSTKRKTSIPACTPGQPGTPWSSQITWTQNSWPKSSPIRRWQHCSHPWQDHWNRNKRMIASCFMRFSQGIKW